jgi:hypothetical protein
MPGRAGAAGRTGCVTASIGRVCGTMLRVTAVGEVARAGYTVLGWRVGDIAGAVRGLEAASGGEPRLVRDKNP